MTYFTFSNFQNDYFQEVASFNFGEKEITEAYQIKFHTLKRMKPELDFHKKNIHNEQDTVRVHVIF